VPPKQRLRADQERRPALSREHPARRRQEQPVAAAKARPGNLPLEHRKLVAKDHYLDAVMQTVR
jgi:hypothetical protein